MCVPSGSWVVVAAAAVTVVDAFVGVFGRVGIRGGGCGVCWKYIGTGK